MEIGEKQKFFPEDKIGAAVRFLNAVPSFPSLTVFIGEKKVTENLPFGHLETPSLRDAGFSTIRAGFDTRCLAPFSDAAIAFLPEHSYIVALVLRENTISFWRISEHPSPGLRVFNLWAGGPIGIFQEDGGETLRLPYLSSQKIPDPPETLYIKQDGGDVFHLAAGISVPEGNRSFLFLMGKDGRMFYQFVRGK